MTSQEKDRYICQQLGICWHETGGVAIIENERLFRKCRLCNKVFRDDDNEWAENDDNPSFTSEAGRVQLLKLIVNHEKYEDFCCDIGTGIFTIPVRYMEDDTGKFRDAVFKWLGGEE